MKILICFSILLLVFSMNVGNQMTMPEAKQCELYAPHFCRKWLVLICNTFCKFKCKSIHAKGKCFDDESCHCYCC
ncbi:hypothetical protein MtrunA17_Chr1g0152261 [Medicago truncatula]|uniref:Uncharacterized protein n=1 Tax=Medicago truncatula TaxID=3880 RepID=A0A396JLL0_MEDTR|nr:hypothetical protein MtrunA17_Chr1g0152261 [Medicago truncatula]